METQVTVPATTLAEALRWIAPHVASDTTRPALTAIRVVANGSSELQLQATDSYSLIALTIAGADVDGGDLDVLVDGRALAKFRAPAKSAAPVDVARIVRNGNGRLEVSALGSETLLALPVMDAVFPRFDQLFPDEAQLAGIDAPLGLAAGALRKLGVISCPAPLRFRFVSPLRPVLVETEDESRGVTVRMLLMPVRLP